MQTPHSEQERPATPAASRFRNDSDLVRVSRQIDRHLRKVYELCDELAESEYEPARGFAGDLESNEIPAMAHATSLVTRHLNRPERWRHTFRDIVKVERALAGDAAPGAGEAVE